MWSGWNFDHRVIIEPPVFLRRIFTWKHVLLLCFIVMVILVFFYYAVISFYLFNVAFELQATRYNVSFYQYLHYVQFYDVHTEGYIYSWFIIYWSYVHKIFTPIFRKVTDEVQQVNSLYTFKVYGPFVDMFWHWYLARTSRLIWFFYRLATDDPVKFPKHLAFGYDPMYTAYDGVVFKYYWYFHWIFLRIPYYITSLATNPYQHEFFRTTNWLLVDQMIKSKMLEYHDLVYR